jgi:hypothetical protein
MSFNKRFTASFDIVIGTIGTTSFEFSLTILVFIVGVGTAVDIDIDGVNKL